jgi:predicted ATPase
VRAQLDRILRSRAFSNAPSLSRFLTLVVRHALEGNGNGLKEYTIGVEAFARPESFDPRIDNIVRVQARKLRAKLGQYYASEGRADPIVIEVPKGQYTAEIRHPPHPPSAAMHSVPRAPMRPGMPPAPRTSLIGRDEELAAVKRMLLEKDVRLLTLTGAGGIGKTRVAVQVAHDLAGGFPGGLWFVPLSSIADPRMVAPELAEALAVRYTDGKPVAVALQEHVRFTTHAPALLVIDNFEHLLDSAPLLGELLDASAAVKILVTSRVALGVYGEHEFHVPPLATPDLGRLPPLSQLCRNPAVDLFLQRAAAVNPAFKLDSDNARAISEICLRLDGLPLAIELAAARMRTLPPDGMLARFDRRLELLTGGPRDVPARQQTLRNTIDWSYGLLNAGEQKLFRRLSVFAGGCTLESAEAVCDAHRDLGLIASDGISSLISQNLLEQRDNGGEPRFLMLETVREYALERLVESGEGGATRRAHAAYALVIAEERNTALSPGAIAEWLDLCGAERDNLRAAIDWLIENDDGEWALRLGVALFPFWEDREHLAEGRARLQAVLNMASAQPRTGARARAAFCAGTLMAAERDYEEAFRLYCEALEVYRELGDGNGVAAMLSCAGTNRRLCGDFETARSLLESALDAYRAMGDRPGIAGALSNLADVFAAQGDCAPARSLYREGLSTFSELGDSAGAAWTYNHLADLAFRQRDFAEARRLYERAAGIFDALSDHWGMARSYTDLGYLACEEAAHDTAAALFEKALRVHMELGHMRGVAAALDGLACLAVRQASHARALALAGAAGELRRAVGAPLRPDERETLERSLAPAWRACGAEDGRAFWASGSEMPREEAIRFALEKRA